MIAHGPNAAGAHDSKEKRSPEWSTLLHERDADSSSERRREAIEESRASPQSTAISTEEDDQEEKSSHPKASRTEQN